VPPTRADLLLAAAAATPGFLPADEAGALFEVACRAACSDLGPLVEIGSYLGRSTLFIAAALAAVEGRAVLFSVDHHHGSEELQAGWPDHDPQLVDPQTGRIDTLARFRRAIESAGAEDLVVAVVGDSATVAANWGRQVALIFVDGGTEKKCPGPTTALGAAGGGGRLPRLPRRLPRPTRRWSPPLRCYLDALASGEFTEDVGAGVGSLRVLLRTGSAKRRE